LKTKKQFHGNSLWYILRESTLDVWCGSGLNYLFIVSWFTPQKCHGAPWLLPEETKLDKMLEDGMHCAPPANGQENMGLEQSHPK